MSGSEVTMRRPSGSSRSRGHSPSRPPAHTVTQRRVLSGGSMLGVGLGSAGSLNVLNSGWQVWGSTPASRHASTSSAPSLSDPSVSQKDTYRPNIGESWSSRSTSGTWEEMCDNPQRPDLPQLEGSMSLHQSRTRQSASTQPAVITTPPKQGQFSPQRYSGRESGNAAHYPSPAKSAYNIASPYSGQQPLRLNGSSGASYDSLQTQASQDDDLSIALRGMAVADDYSLSQQSHSYRQSGSPQSSPMTTGGTQSMLPQVTTQAQLRGFSGYPQIDFSTYYPGPSAQQYGYDTYRATPDHSLYLSSPALSTIPPTPNVFPAMPQAIPTHSVTDAHNSQSALYYDYPGSPHMGSQYYYPTQPVLFPHPSHSPVHVADRKPELLPYNMHQHHPSQLPPQNPMYNAMRSSQSPHSQAYATAMDYNAPLALMVTPGAMYGHAPMHASALHPYHPGARARRGGSGSEHRIAIRSPLLEEFRTNKSRKWELRDIYGYIVEFSGDQHGSRFIQQRIESATEQERQVIFDEIVPNHALQLIQDVFGNYVVQKLFEHGTASQRSLLANTMEGHILPLSLQMYGCRVVQKAVEHITPEQQSVFVKELDASALRCVKDANGNHVIQKLLQCVPPERLGFIKTFQGHVHDLATHPYGCRVLQRCFEHLPEDHTRPLLDELHEKITSLMQDQFGNYVVQFVLEHGKPEDRKTIIAKLSGQMLDMARHKFASNVCEKALLTADVDNRRLLIDEMLNTKHEGGAPVLTMMKDQYANYVLQRALSVAEGEQREAMVSIIKPQLANMRRLSGTHTKHLNAIERLIGKGPSAESSANEQDMTDRP